MYFLDMKLRNINIAGFGLVLVAGFVVVIRERSTTHGDVQNLLESARLADCKLLGFAKVGCISSRKRRRRGYGYYYYQYY